jgi:cell division protein ZapA (FtsZ GTPase activity inhibitor)
MDNTKKRITLDIAGYRLNIVTDEDHSYVNKLADIISKQVSTLALSGSGITKTDAALLYALDLLDENVKLKMELAAMKKDR